MSNKLPCLSCGAEANEWCKPNCRPPEHEELAPPPENRDVPNTGNRDSEEERAHDFAWEHYSCDGDDAFDIAKAAALWGLRTSRAELLAEVKRLRAALLIAKTWDETGCCELPAEGKPRLSEICVEALGTGKPKD